MNLTPHLPAYLAGSYGWDFALSIDGGGEEEKGSKMAIRRATATVTGATGGAGVATAFAYTDKPVDGEVIGVHLAYQDSPPGATTDVSIIEANNSPAQTVLTISNAATDGWFYPLAAGVNQAGAAITNSGRPIKVSDTLKVTITGANNGDGVIATIVYDDLRG